MIHAAGRRAGSGPIRKAVQSETGLLLFIAARGVETVFFSSVFPLSSSLPPLSQPERSSDSLLSALTLPPLGVCHFQVQPFVIRHMQIN